MDNIDGQYLQTLADEYIKLAQDYKDARVELEETLILLIETEEMSNEKLHTLRGEARALYRVWKRRERIHEFLKDEINNKTIKEQ